MKAPPPDKSLIAQFDSDQMQRTASALAMFSGFYAVRLAPNIPCACNNPGMLTWADGQPNAEPYVIVQTASETQAVCLFDTLEHGWEALYQRIVAFASQPALNVLTFMRQWTPVSDERNVGFLASYLARQLHCDIGDKLSDVLTVGSATPAATTKES